MVAFQVVCTRKDLKTWAVKYKDLMATLAARGHNNPKCCPRGIPLNVWIALHRNAFPNHVKIVSRRQTSQKRKKRVTKRV